jgi:MFS family permease
VAVALLIVILDYGARTSFGVFFKPMLSDFDWTRALTSGSLTLSMLCQGASGIIMGRLNDKLGPRFVMTLCSCLLGVGFLLMSVVNGVWQLYVFYGIIFGLGMGGAFVALLSTVARWFVKMRGFMTGIAIAGTGIGQLIVSPVANLLISAYDWRISYIIVGGIVLVIGVLLSQLLKRDPAKIGLVPYGSNSGEKQKSMSSDHELSIGEAIRTRQYWMTVIIFFSVGYTIMAMNAHLVPHITDLGISATTAANIFAVSGGVSAIGCIVMGSVIDRLGSRRVCVICYLLIVGAVLWLTQITAVWLLFLFAIIYGLGVGGGTPIESTLVAELFGMRSHGLIFGTVSCGFTAGAALGPFVTGYLFDLNGNYQLAFLGCGGVTAIGLILAAILRPIKSTSLEYNVSNHD